MADENGRPEREFEIGRDEAWFANVKRTYDEHETARLEDLRRARERENQALLEAQKHLAHVNAVALQHLQNAVTQSEQLASQSLRQLDIAADRQWNPDEVARLTTPPVVEGIAAAVAAKVVDGLRSGPSSPA